jgi:hypothetical protein
VPGGGSAAIPSASVSCAAAWVGICLGCAAGAVQGLFFHRETWLSEYDSWPKRMLRLGHISLVALGLINLGFSLTVSALVRWTRPFPRSNYEIRLEGRPPGTAIVTLKPKIFPPIDSMSFLDTWNRPCSVHP